MRMRLLILALLVFGCTEPAHEFARPDVLDPRGVRACGGYTALDGQRWADVTLTEWDINTETGEVLDESVIEQELQLYAWRNGCAVALLGAAFHTGEDALELSATYWRPFSAWWIWSDLQGTCNLESCLIATEFLWFNSEGSVVGWYQSEWDIAWGEDISPPDYPLP